MVHARVCFTTKFLHGSGVYLLLEMYSASELPVIPPRLTGWPQTTLGSFREELFCPSLLTFLVVFRLSAAPWVVHPSFCL